MYNTDPINNYITLAFAGNNLIPAQSIAIDNPLIGDKDSLIYTRVDSKSRTGNIVILSKPYWPKLRQLELQFNWIKPNKGIQLANFILATAGLQITLTDWYNKLWNGIILNPEAEMSQQLHGFAVTYTFEGTPSGVATQL